MLRRLREPLFVPLAGAVGATALLLRDPHTPGSWGRCPFLVLTGHPCPACGGLRAVDDLLHGNVVAALGSNAYVVATVLLALVTWGVWLVRRVRGLPTGWRPWHGRVASLWLAGLAVFGVLRLVVPALAVLQP